MRTFPSKARARQLAGAQGGRITWAQMLALGLTTAQARRWVQSGQLTRTLPSVYALGYVRDDRTAVLWEAVLYAGPDAYLTGGCGSHHLGLLAAQPRTIKVATPWQRQSRPGIIVLSRRPGIRRVDRRTGLPVAPHPELLLELAAEGALHPVRIALANLDYRRELDPAAMLAVGARGRRGSRLLRQALARRLPQLAHCRSPLEVDFILLLEAARRALPRVNVRLHGILVDAWWPELSLVVELDGQGNHGTAAQQRRDAESAARLRAHGLTVVRFTWDDVHRAADRTLATLGGLGVS